MAPTKKRTGWLFPRHQYLGPGNPIDSAEPVDEDDRVARAHDVAYERARTREDVEQADNEAVDKFVNAGTLHGAIGAIGLEVKKTWENTFGQVYPAMAPTPKPTHRGQKLYGIRQKEIARNYREQKEHEDFSKRPKSWNEFIKTYWKNYKAGSSTTTQNPRESVEGRAGTSGVQTRGSLKRAATDQQGDTPSEKRTGIDPDEFLRHWTDTHLNADNTFDTAMSNVDIESMEAVANPSTGASKSSGGIVSTGKSGASAGGRSTGGGGNMIVGIPRAPKTEYYTKAYRKSWCFFSYGFTHNVIPSDNNNWYTTPLALIPVDLLAFYMDEVEFSLLHGRCVAVEARVSVMPLGCRMNFQVNSTTSGWATSEFVAIGQSVIGLNMAMPILNRKYTPNSTKPMVVESTVELDRDDIEEKLYGGSLTGNFDGVKGTGMAQMVPRHLNAYACLVQPTSLEANTAAGLMRNIYGPPKLDQYIDRFLVNTAVGTPIVDYTYHFKNGIIYDKYDTMSYNRMAGKDSNYYIQADGTQASAKPNVVTPGTASETGAISQQTKANAINAWKTMFDSGRYQTIENYLTYKWTEGQTLDNMQPQVHVGLTAVPAINPANDTADFQNTSIYWSVQTELVVHHYQNSSLHYGPYFTYAPNFYDASSTRGNARKEYFSGLGYNHHPDVQTYNAIASTYKDDSNALPIPMDMDDSRPMLFRRPPKTNKTFGTASNA